jgi:thiamine biosynthesis lipoprotein
MARKVTNRSTRIWGLTLGLLFGLGTDACTSAPISPWDRKPAGALVREYKAQAMGSTFTVRIWLSNASPKNPELQAFAPALNEIRRIAKIADNDDNRSEISLVNGLAAVRPVKLSPELFEMVELSQRMSARSNGSFDVTFVPYQEETEKYGKDAGLDSGHYEFGPELSHLRNVVGNSKLILDAAARTLRFASPEVKIGLKGLAKGYAIQRAVRAMEAKIPGRKFKGIAVIGGGMIYAAGEALRDRNLMCLEHSSELGVCAYSILPNDLTKPFVLASISTASRPGHVYSPKDGTRKARAGNCFVTGTDPTWVQAAATAAAVMDNKQTEAFLSRDDQPLLRGVFYESDYTIALKGSFEPYAKTRGQLVSEASGPATPTVK